MVEKGTTMTNGGGSFVYKVRRVLSRLSDPFSSTSEDLGPVLMTPILFVFPWDPLSFASLILTGSSGGRKDTLSVLGWSVRGCHKVEPSPSRKKN